MAPVGVSRVRPRTRRELGLSNPSHLSPLSQLYTWGNEESPISNPSGSMKGIRKRIPFQDGVRMDFRLGALTRPRFASERGGSRALHASRRARWLRRRMTHSNGPGTVYGHSNGPRTTHEGLVLVLLLVPVLALVLVLVVVSDNFFFMLNDRSCR